MADVDELGRRGYERHIWGDYKEAISYYSDAINKYPDDERLYNNRCMCYYALKNYKKAMKDANHMVRMFPGNRRSFYRKAEILFKLEKFEEAEEFFRMALNVDPRCEEAKYDIRDAQIAQICKGLNFSWEEGLEALNVLGNVKDAREALVNEEIIYHQKSLKDEEDSQIDPLQDPTNPYRSSSLWVGGIDKDVPESFLKLVFSGYGRIKNVQLMSRADNPFKYAFINYHDTESPGKAMEGLQGLEDRMKMKKVRRHFQGLHDVWKSENDLLPSVGFVVGDDAFPLKTYLLNSYSHKPVCKHKKILNYRQ